MGQDARKRELKGGLQWPWIRCGVWVHRQQGGHAVRLSLGVSQHQGRATRTTKQQPLVNIQGLSQLLHIRQEMCRRIDRKIGAQVTGVWRTPATPALVEQNDPVGLRIEVAPYPG